MWAWWVNPKRNGKEPGRFMEKWVCVGCGAWAVYVRRVPL
jgi:hypothetical protein